MGQIQWRRFLFNSKNSSPFDLVLASYVLSELKNSEERKTIIQNLWKSTEPGGLIVIIIFL